MRLNTLKPAPGSRRAARRVGRGASAGQGKTCGRGTKGQRARKGGYHKVGFEGGQMPLQRRMPKVGFRSRMKASRAEVRLAELARVEASVVDLEALLKAGVVPPGTERAKVVLSGALTRAVTLKGVAVTKRSEEHTSELQSRRDLVCRLLLEKKKKENVLLDVRVTLLPSPRY